MTNIIVYVLYKELPSAIVTIVQALLVQASVLGIDVKGSEGLAFVVAVVAAEMELVVVVVVGAAEEEPAVVVV